MKYDIIFSFCRKIYKEILFKNICNNRPAFWRDIINNTLVPQNLVDFFLSRKCDTMTTFFRLTTRHVCASNWWKVISTQNAHNALIPSLHWICDCLCTVNIITITTCYYCLLFNVLLILKHKEQFQSFTCYNSSLWKITVPIH